MQAARELGDVAKRAPARVAALLPKLRAADQQAPMTEGAKPHASAASVASTETKSTAASAQPACRAFATARGDAERPARACTEEIR